ncbi:hypothetical protein ATCC90586_010881 [Pythium insidiosum]|nr:hypothetical protein ATCC90586_010881 [Pythium insidiosum]
MSSPADDAAYLRQLEVSLRARVATLTTERDRLTAELIHASSRARVRDTRPSDALRARVEDAEAEIIRLNDRVATLQSALAEFERLGTAATLAGIVRRCDIYRRLGDSIELEAFVESAQAESAMLRAVVRELTVEIGWYEDLLGPMVLSLSRQEALVSPLVRAACAPPLPADTAVQPLSPLALPRMVSAIVGMIPDDIARSPPSTAAALERLEMALADRDATLPAAGGIDRPCRALGGSPEASGLAGCVFTPQQDRPQVVGSVVCRLGIGSSVRWRRSRGQVAPGRLQAAGHIFRQRRGQRTTRDELMALQSGSTSWDSLWPQEEPTMRSWPLGADHAAADTFRLLPWYSGYLPRDLEQNAPNNMAKTEALAAGGRLYSAAELGSFYANEPWQCLRHPPEPISFDAADPRFKPLHLATLTFYRQHARALWDRTHFFLPAEGPGRSELLAQRRRRNSSVSAALKQHCRFLMDFVRDNSSFVDADLFLDPFFFLAASGQRVTGIRSRVFGKFISAPPPVTVGPHLDAPSPSPPRLTPVSPPGLPTSAVLDALRQRQSSGSPDADPSADAAHEPCVDSVPLDAQTDDSVAPS